MRYPNQSLKGITRRHFFKQTGFGIGALALTALMNDRVFAADAAQNTAAPVANPFAVRPPHFAPKAKRVIFLFMAGAPSQLDLFDHKPKLADLRGAELPDSIRQGQRLTGMTSRQASFPIAPSRFQFAQHGQSGAWVS